MASLLFWDNPSTWHCILRCKHSVANYIDAEGSLVKVRDAIPGKLWTLPMLQTIPSPINRWEGVREAPLKMLSPLFGHCPNSDCTPPPPSKGHSGALFSGPISATLSNHHFEGMWVPQRILASLKSIVNKRKYQIELQFSLHKCPKPSWQGFRPPLNQANACLNLVNSSLKKCPKPSGQGFRPPPPLRAMPK